MTSLFVLTRDEYIKQLTSRYAPDELMFVPLTFTPASLDEMAEYTNYDFDTDLSLVTPQEFSDYVDALNNDDDFYDAADAIANHHLRNLLIQRGNNNG